jgi:hypothetical protein
MVNINGLEDVQKKPDMVDINSLKDVQKKS